jgi:diguanylate cyclase (GGDEF)-like protein
VTREELKKRIWPNEVHVEFEHGLNNAIHRFREAFGDARDALETLPRRGYRFLGEVEWVDSLTGLLNLRAFDPTLANALASYSEGSEIVAVILADLDRFKLVNDTFGYWAGDEVLKRVASLLQAITRDEAVVCRYHADRFIALCATTTEPRARQLAVRIETEVRSLAVNWEGHDIGPLSISTVLAFCPRDGRHAEDLIHAADVALFRKKRGDDDDNPPSPIAVAMRIPKPSPPTDARAGLPTNLSSRKRFKVFPSKDRSSEN